MKQRRALRLGSCGTKTLWNTRIFRSGLAWLRALVEGLFQRTWSGL